MKKTLILYGSPKRYSAAYRKVTGLGQPEYFVRSELSPFPMKEALDHVKMIEGETVLNTVEVEQ